MPLELNDRVTGRDGVHGTVNFAYHNRARNEWSYYIVWDNGMSGSFDEWQIRLNQIAKFDPFRKTLEIMGMWPLNAQVSI